MKTINSLIAAPICIALSLVLVGCGDSHEKVSEDVMDTMDKVATIISEVKDKESAEEAAKKIEGMEEDFKKLAERMKALGEPAKELSDKLEEKYTPRMKEAQQKIFKAMQALSANPEAAMAISNAMTKFGEQMQSLD